MRIRYMKCMLPGVFLLTTASLPAQQPAQRCDSLMRGPVPGTSDVLTLVTGCGAPARAQLLGRYSSETGRSTSAETNLVMGLWNVRSADVFSAAERVLGNQAHSRTARLGAIVLLLRQWHPNVTIQQNEYDLLDSGRPEAECRTYVRSDGFRASGLAGSYLAVAPLPTDSLERLNKAIRAAAAPSEPDPEVRKLANCALRVVPGLPTPADKPGRP